MAIPALLESCRKTCSGDESDLVFNCQGFQDTSDGVRKIDKALDHTYNTQLLGQKSQNKKSYEQCTDGWKAFHKQECSLSKGARLGATWDSSN